MLGVNRGERRDNNDGRDGARCGQRASLSKNPRLSVYADAFFFNIRSSPPPPPPPQMQISFESRLGEHDVLNDCTMTVNGTDFRIPQKGTATKGNAFASHKYAGKSTLRYELGVDILPGNLVWIQGLYPAGKYTDIKIFNKVLRNFLEVDERVEADKGYRGHPEKIKCPGNDANPAENRGMQGRARARHDMLNGRLKNWGILSQVFRHHIMMHGDVFRASAVVMQLTIEYGEPLFEVEYGD
jgi:hypothetical protein